MKVVSNATPIISLSAIDHLSLLQKLFGPIYVPKAVHEEIKVVGIAVLFMKIF